MAKTAKPKANRKLRRAVKNLKSRLQVGALCYRLTKKGNIRILLVTSRRTKRWISPKGWPMSRKTHAQAAAQEAWEEAGIRGRISEKSIGFYTYPKYLSGGRFIPCTVQLFPLEVTEQATVFPEYSQRRTKWFKPEKAAKQVMEPELRRLILRFAHQKAAGSA